MRRREREREQSCIKKARREGSGWLCARSASPLPARPTDRPTFNLHFLSRRRRYRFVSPLSLPPLSLFVVYQDAWLKFPCHGQLHRQQFSFSHIRVHLRSMGTILNFRSGQSVPGGGFFSLLFVGVWRRRAHTCGASEFISASVQTYRPLAPRSDLLENATPRAAGRN